LSVVEGKRLMLAFRDRAGVDFFQPWLELSTNLDLDELVLPLERIVGGMGGNLEDNEAFSVAMVVRLLEEMGGREGSLPSVTVSLVQQHGASRLEAVDRPLREYAQEGAA